MVQLGGWSDASFPQVIPVEEINNLWHYKKAAY
jgi:hypothetical protein